MSAVVNHLSFNFVNQLVHIIDIGIILNRSRVIAAPGRLSTLWEKESCRGRASTLERASGGLVPPGRVTVSLRVKEVTTHQRFQSLHSMETKEQTRHIKGAASRVCGMVKQTEFTYRSVTIINGS